jgi:pimeloyl-ACP methyl ester carboxylesterase
VLPGEHDVVVPPDAAREVADALPGSALRVAAGTAHLPPAEDPSGVADILLTFLEEAADG